jgi:uroporphyrinogen-III synthase
VTRRVALTTTADRALSLGGLLRGRELEPVSLPCIEVLAAGAAMVESTRRIVVDCDLLVLTSARVVEVLWPAGDMPPVPVAAVGASTATAASEAGGSVTVVGTGGGADLVAAIADSVRGKDVVFPHASGADPATLEGLLLAGASVTSEVVYETRPIAPGDDEVDAVIFGSPMAVDGWHLSRKLDGLIVGAVGATTASALDHLGTPPHVIPETPSFDRLVELVAAELTERSTV